jgi:hypothetical protein
MLVKARFDSPPDLPEEFEARWEGPDRGLIAAWVRGIGKRQESPELAAACERGELPVLAWKGGCSPDTKVTKKIGSLLYLATWQALRGEDLCIDTDTEPVMRCALTRIRVKFTLDIKKLLKETKDGRAGN